MPKPLNFGKSTDIYQKPGTTSYTTLSNKGNRTTPIQRLNANKNFNPMANAVQATQYNRQLAAAANAAAQPVTPPPSTGGGGVYSGGTGAVSAAPAVTAAPAAPDTSYMQRYIEQLQNAMTDAQANAKAAQERAEAQLKAAQEAQRKAREEAYARGTAQQQTNYEYGRGQVNDAADSALRQAYINRMQQQRNLNQLLSAQGLNGGASETTTAGMLNNYANSRNALENERTAQLASLMNTYQNNLAELANQKASGDAADLTSYQTNLGNLAANNANNMISLIQGYANMAANMPQLRPTFNSSTGQWEYSYV